MRGEHKIEGKSRKTDGGSSPHARGALCTRPLGARRAGIIPACAGSTCRTSWPVSPAGDHPRMRGEHASTRSKPLRPMGSSPHARGAPLSKASTQVAAGIIPACAGSTVCADTFFNGRRDHPRMRGEHSTRHGPTRRARGSSPHARGAPARGARPRGRAGIIPACAGSTGFAATAPDVFWDHPRMRGEHCRRAPRRMRQAGSSPHARGAPDPSDMSVAVSGIIPACAGSTWRP